MSADLVLRRAEHDDARAIADLFLASRAEALPYLPRLHTDNETRIWIYAVVLARHRVWVALLDGGIAGFVALNGDWVDHLYVHPRHFRQGVGDSLLALTKEKSAGRLHLWTFQRNAPARNFYERRGFYAVKLTDGAGNEEREPDVLYAWPYPG